MPQLANKKRELFAQFLSSPGTMQHEAYQAAGYTPSSSNASILANTEEIKRRVKEIKAEKAQEELEFKLRLRQAGVDPDSADGVTEKKAWDADRIRDMLATNATMAQVVGDFKSAMESIALIGKTLHLFDKEESGERKPSRPEVSIALINQAAGADSPGSRSILVEQSNPLAPRLPSAGNVERLE